MSKPGVRRRIAKLQQNLNIEWEHDAVQKEITHLQTLLNDPKRALRVHNDDLHNGLDWLATHVKQREKEKLHIIEKLTKEREKKRPTFDPDGPLQDIVNEQDLP